MSEIQGLRDKAEHKQVSGELVEQAFVMFCNVMRNDPRVLEMIIDDLEKEALEQVLDFLTFSNHYTDTYKEMIHNHYWRHINSDK